MAYRYNKAGGLEEETYPTGRTVKTCYDGAGRPVSVLKPDNTAWAAAAVYGAAGLASLTLGNTIVESWEYNERQQVKTVKASKTGVALFELAYTYGTNDNIGNVQTQQMTHRGASGTVSSGKTLTYVYDPISRLQSVSEGAGFLAQVFDYDAWGNRAITSGWNPKNSPAATTFLSGDHLGSTRLVTDATGGVLKRFDFAGKSGTIADDRIFANVSSSLEGSLKATGNFASAPGHGPFRSSLKSTDGRLGNIQTSFQGTYADIDGGDIDDGLGDKAGGENHGESHRESQQCAAIHFLNIPSELETQAQLDAAWRLGSHRTSEEGRAQGAHERPVVHPVQQIERIGSTFRFTWPVTRYELSKPPGRGGGGKSLKINDL